MTTTAQRLFTRALASDDVFAAGRPSIATDTGRVIAPTEGTKAHKVAKGFTILLRAQGYTILK